MCGIVGMYRRDTPVDQDLLRRMTRVLAHRGPDDEGYHLQPPVGLGVRRLSIIDVAGGHQPISNEDGRFTIVFNGEVYNYLELREELVARGHRFVTRTDTEVVVHLYEDLGPKCLTRLNGMFAFAVWDAADQELFVARDRLGVKPLYYWADGSSVIFASELKALLLCPAIGRALDRQALADYLTFMYIPAPKTPFQEIRKLLPGHYFRCGRGGLTLHRYWSLADYAEPHHAAQGEAATRVRELLDDAVRLRLRSDVPVGSFLSGGMDSSSIVALAVRHLDRPLSTFSVGFTGARMDERPYSRLVASANATEHHEIQVTAADASRLLPKLVWHLDEPNGDSAFVPTYLVSQLAATRARVILSGLGGDEIFGGYSRYRLPLERQRRGILSPELVPEFLRRRIVLSLAGRLSARLHAWLARDPTSPEHERYLRSVTIFSAEEKTKLLGQNGWRPPDEVACHYRAYPGGDPVNRLLFVDAHTYLPDDILALTDRVSMAASLEARTPFLDYRLVEYCAGLPGSFKLTASAGKILLKEAMAPLVPPAVIQRAKWGFGAPVGEWLVALLPKVRAVLCGGWLVREWLVDRPVVDRLLGRFERTGVGGQQVWTLLVLEVWGRLYAERSPTEAPTASLEDLVEAGL